MFFFNVVHMEKDSYIINRNLTCKYVSDVRIEL